MNAKPKVVVIVGPTASGKTSLSVEIAKKFNGEIVSADSRQVYKGLDLGTGKVTKKEMQGIPHHLLDVADPKETYTVSDYTRDGRKAVTGILERKHLPVIVGGSFFYVDALLGKISTPEVAPNPELREKLEAMTIEALYAALEKLDEERALDIDPHNKRRLIRALEIVEAVGKVPKGEGTILYNTLAIGTEIDQKELYQNIHERLYKRVEIGMVDEVKSLHEKGLTYERMEELGLEYRYIARYLQGQLEKKEMLEELEIKTRQFAKRQMTWLKRDKSIKWIKPHGMSCITKEIQQFLENAV